MEKMESWNPKNNLNKEQRNNLKEELEKIDINQDSDNIESLQLLNEAKKILANKENPADSWWEKAQQKREDFEKIKTEKEEELNKLNSDPQTKDEEESEKLKEEIEQIKEILEKLYGQFGNKEI